MIHRTPAPFISLNVLVVLHPPRQPMVVRPIDGDITAFPNPNFSYFLASTASPPTPPPMKMSGYVTGMR